MINEQLISYIKDQRDAGTDDSTIKDSLLEAGWREDDIDEGFEAVENGLAEGSPASHQNIRQDAKSNQAEEDSGTDTNSSESKIKRSVQKTTTGSSKNSNTASESKISNSSDSANTEQSDQQNQLAKNDSSQTDQVADRGSQSANEDPVTMRTMESDTSSANGEPASQPDKFKVDNTQEKKDDPQAEIDRLSENTYREPASQISTGSSLDASEKKPEEGRDDDGVKISNKSPNRSSASAGSQNTSNANKKSSNRTNRSGRSTNQPSRIQQARKDQSSSNFLAIAGAVIALILIGGAGAYAYFNFFAGSGNAVSAQAVLASLANTQTFEYRIGVGPQNAPSADSTFVLEGAVDIDPSTPEESYFTIRGNQADQPISGQMTEFSTYPELSEQKKQSIRSAFASQSAFNVGGFQTEQTLGADPNATSSGFETNRYEVSAQPAQAAMLYGSIYETMFDSSLPENTQTALANALGGFSANEGQMWIDPDTNVPYQITFIGENQGGDPTQVNFQFRNHGQPVTAAPATYESRPLAAALSTYLGVEAATSPNPNSTSSDQDVDDNSTLEPTPNPQPDPEPTPDPTPSESSDQNNNESARRGDRLRINDIQTLQVALAIYAQENGAYPGQLIELTNAGIQGLTQMPRDPRTGEMYAYVVSQSQTQFHLGATLEVTAPAELTLDTDFDSTSFSSNGFNGSSSECGVGQLQGGVTCYDITDQI